MIGFLNCWLWDNSGSAYIDNSVEAESDGGTAFEIIGQIEDDLYLGYDYPFKGFVCDVGTAGSYTGLTFKYWDGNSWVQVVPLVSYAFTQDKYLIFPVPLKWVKRTLNDSNEHAVTTLPDSSSRYWLKIEATGVTTTATTNQILCIPQVLYTNPDKVARLLQIKTNFTDETKPTLKGVIELIARAEDRIDFRARKSWRFNFSERTKDSGGTTVNELYDYNRYGIKLKHPDIKKVYSVSLWNGSTWDVLTEGRNNDYFVDNLPGSIFFTRLFLLPAVYGMTGRYFHWGFGEYKKSVQVEYTWGKDARTDYQFQIAEDVATKIAAIEITRNSDYSILTSSGVDKVSIESKVATWREDVENSLEEIVGLFVY